MRHPLGRGGEENGGKFMYGNAGLPCAIEMVGGGVDEE